MYITIIDIMGEKRFDLTYPVQGKEVTVVSMFSGDNFQYQMKKPLKVMLIMNEENQLPERVYTNRELNASIERELKTLMDKLAGIMEMVLSLDNTDNLEN